MENLICKVISKTDKGIEVEIEGQKVVLSQKYFSEDLSTKDKFQLFFLNSKNPDPLDKKLAKLVLEEILNGK